MALSFTQAGKTSTPTTSKSTTTTTNKSADLTLVRGTVSDILNSRAKDIEYQASASAQRTSAAGYDAEIVAYESTGRLATQNALYTKVAGDITDYQDKRATLDTIGKQRAGLAGGGFADSEDIVRSTLQQGYLTRQIDRTQSLFEQSGYLEQAAAAKAEITAAGVAKQSALDTATIYDDASAAAKLAATNETTGLSSYLTKTKAGVTADALLSGTDIGGAIATKPKVTDTSTTGTSTEETPTYTAAAGTKAKNPYYVGPEEGPFGNTDFSKL